MREIWKDIPDYYGLYKISVFGKVKCLGRDVYAKYDTQTMIYKGRKDEGRILMPDKRGRVMLSNFKGKRFIYISEVVNNLFVSDCLNYYESIRFEEGVFCPHCNGEKYYKLKKAFSYRCANKACKKTFNVLTGTIFENTKIGLPTWFKIIYKAKYEGINSCSLARDLVLSQKSAWDIIKKIRTMLLKNAPELLQ